MARQVARPSARGATTGLKLRRSRSTQPSSATPLEGSIVSRLYPRMIREKQLLRLSGHRTIGDGSNRAPRGPSRFSTRRGFRTKSRLCPPQCRGKNATPGLPEISLVYRTRSSPRRHLRLLGELRRFANSCSSERFRTKSLRPFVVRRRLPNIEISEYRRHTLLAAAPHRQV